MSNYNITTDKEHLTINCKDNVLKKDITITYTGALVKETLVDSLNKIPSGEDIALHRFKTSQPFGDISNITTQKFYFSYLASNGIDFYGSFNKSTQLGIYHVNLLTGELSTIYSSGYYWNYFFEDSKGNIYVASSLSKTTGVIKITNGIATKIYSSQCSWQNFFETSKGDIYIGGYSNGTGILHIKDNKATRLAIGGRDWANFFEDSKGNLYVGSGYSATVATYGLYKLTGATATQIYSSGYEWYPILEDSKGNSYWRDEMSASSILRVNNDVATFIQTNADVLFETSKGIMYVICSKLGLFSIGVLEGTTTTIIYSEEFDSKRYGDPSVFESSKGDIYIGFLSTSSTSKEDAGVFCISNNTVTHTYTIGANWSIFREDSKGNIYVSPKKTSFNFTTGIVKLNPSNSKLIYDKGLEWRYLYEKNGDVFLTISKVPYKNDSMCVQIVDDFVYEVLLTKFINPEV